MANNVIPMVPPESTTTTTITISVTLPVETARLVSKFVAVNQPMSVEKLVAVLLEDVGDFMRGPAADWRGAHMSVALYGRGYHDGH